ncbi:unnamed protein product [Effrenium voratum]|nr:unnamed protein product [Effrenium voratum]
MASLTEENNGLGRAAVRELGGVAKANLEAGVRLLQALPKKRLQVNVIHYGVLLHALELKGSWNVTTQLLDQMSQQQVPSNVVTYGSAMKHLSRSAWQRALALVAGMPQDANLQQDPRSFLAGWQRPNAITQTMYTVAEAAAAQVCMELLQVMTVMLLERNDYHFGAAIHACERPGLWRLALGLLQRMRSLHVRGNVVTFTSGLSANAWPQAVALLKAMVQAGPQPNVLSFGATISACEDAEVGGQWDVALQLLRQLPVHAVRPNEVICSAGVRACANLGWQLPLQLLKTMAEEALQNDDVVLNAAISGLAPDASRRSAARRGKGDASPSAGGASNAWPLAAGYLRRMVQEGITPDVISFSCAVAAFELSGLWLLASSMLAAMALVALRANAITLRGAARACESALSPAWQAALRLAGEVVSCNSVLYSCVQAGNLHKALEVLRQMQGKRVDPDVLSYDILVKGCQTAGRWEHVPALLSSSAVLQRHCDRWLYSSGLSLQYGLFELGPWVLLYVEPSSGREQECTACSGCNGELQTAWA